MLLGSPSMLKKPGRKRFGEMFKGPFRRYVYYLQFIEQLKWHSKQQTKRSSSPFAGKQKLIVCMTTEADLTGTQ